VRKGRGEGPRVSGRTGGASPRGKRESPACSIWAASHFQFSSSNFQILRSALKHEHIEKRVRMKVEIDTIKSGARLRLKFVAE